MDKSRTLGPIATRMLPSVRWSDQYPTTPDYRNELDGLLSFAQTQKRKEHFAPRLSAKDSERNAAIEELRVAYLFHREGFPVEEWDPPGLDGRIGEYMIKTPEGKSVFVEVKNPSWEGQLSDDQRRSGRTKLPKYLPDQGGAFANYDDVRRCVERSYLKFSPTIPNLLVIADDFFVPLHESLKHVRIALYNTHPGYEVRGCFTSLEFENLGGVGVFRAVSRGWFTTKGMEYEFVIYPNPCALPTAALPASLLKFTNKATRLVFPS